MLSNILAQKKKAAIFALVFILGAVLSSLFWIYQIKNAQSLLDYREFEIKNLKDQTKTLRDSYNTITPTPTSLSYIKKEALSANNIYSLSCFTSEQKTDTEWLKILKTKVSPEETITNYCYNSNLNSLLYITSKDLGGGGMGRPSGLEFKLGILSIPTNTINILRTSKGTYLDGVCNKLTGWTKTNNIYYSCSGGDGPWSQETSYQVNIASKATGITEKCFQEEGKEKNCTTYSDYQACKEKHLL